MPKTPEYDPGDLNEALGVDPITHRPGANSSLPQGTHSFVPTTTRSNRAFGRDAIRTRSGQKRPSAGDPLGSDR